MKSLCSLFSNCIWSNALAIASKYPNWRSVALLYFHRSAADFKIYYDAIFRKGQSVPFSYYTSKGEICFSGLLTYWSKRVCAHHTSPFSTNMVERRCLNSGKLKFSNILIVENSNLIQNERKGDAYAVAGSK